MTEEEFIKKMKYYTDELDKLFEENNMLEKQIKNNLEKLKYDNF